MAVVAASVAFFWVVAHWSTCENDHKNTSTVDELFASTAPCELLSADSPEPEPGCAEPSDIASPRTLYSSRSFSQYKDWFQFNNEILEKNSYSSELNLLGDSITESWRGTSVGNPCRRCAEIPEVREEFFGKDYVGVWAIAGDQTQHLLYRIQTAREKIARQTGPDTAFVVLIGTNNLGAGYNVKDTFTGIVATVDELLRTSTSRHILLLQLLPRADDDSPWKPSTWAHTTFQDAVDQVNAMLVQHKPFQTNERVSLLNCNAPLLTKEKLLNWDLMPDGLHPNAQGHRFLAQCILDCWHDGKCG